MRSPGSSAIIWRNEVRLQITRYLSLNENQFLGCASAFIDSLTAELGSATTYLRRLSGMRKGSAFAYEMQLDRHRYGALIVLERWSDFVKAFTGSVELGARQEMFNSAVKKVEGCQNILHKANHMLDEAGSYDDVAVEACVMAFRTVELSFEEEKAAASQMTSLGPMLPEEYKEYRRVFQGDLNAR